MNYLMTLIAAIFLTAATLIATAETPSAPTNVYPIPSSSVVKVDIASGHCSGVHVGDGFFLTARHCFGELNYPSNYTVSVNDEDTYIKWTWKSHDVALLKVPSMSAYPSAKVSCKMPAIGDPVKAEGNGRNTGWVITFGTVVGLESKNKDEPYMFMHSAPVADGMSGGPLWNTDGEVIAINVARLNENTSFSISSPIAKFCREIPGTEEYLEQQEKMKKAKK